MKIGAIYGSQVASGSVGNVVASHNAGGLYLRNKAIPKQPNSAQQAAVKARMVQLSAAWGLLTQAQKDAWTSYAAEVSKVNSIGASIKVSGRNWFIANNSERLAAAMPVISNGPTQMSLAQLSAPTISCSTGGSLSVAFTNTDQWATSSGGALILFSSRGISPARNFFKGPFRYAGKISGSASPPTSPATISSPFTIANGQKVYWRAVAAEADGRVSASVTGFCTASIA